MHSTPRKDLLLPRFEHTFALVSDNFLGFMEELVRRDYELVDWMNTLKTEPYAW